MGRKGRLKLERRLARRQSINDAWGFFTSRRNLFQIRKMILDSGAKVNSCICCTKVLVELGEATGLDIRPLTVETTVFNPVFADFIEKKGLDPTEEDMHAMGKAGGRFVVIGSRRDGDAEPGCWPGHLVAVMRAAGKTPVVIDLTIDQANRPNKDIHITDPLVFGVPSGFLMGRAIATGFYPTKAGKICFVYRAIPNDTTYEASPDWQRDYGARTINKIEFVQPSDAD